MVELSGIPAGLTIGTGTGDQFVAIQKSAGTSVIYVPLAQAETLLGNYTLRYKADLSGEYPISMKAYGMEPANGDTSGASLATLTVDIAGSVRSPDAPLLLHNTAVSISEQQVRLEEAPFLKTALAAGSYVSVSDRVRLSSEVPKDSSEQLRVIVSNNTDLRYYKLIVDDLGAERFQILQATPENSGEFSLTVSDFKNLYVTAPRFDSYTIEKTFTVRTELIEGDYQQDFSTGSEADRSDPIDVSILVKSVASGVDQTGLKAKVITSLDAREDELGEISLRDFFSSDVGNLPDYLIDETGEALRLKVYFDASKVRLIRTVGSSNPVVQNDAKAPQGTPNYVVVDGADIENIVLSTPNNAVGELKFNLKAYSKESDGSKSTEVDLGVVQVDVKPVIDFGEGDLRLPQQVNARLWSADKASVPIILNFTDAEELVDAQTSVRLTFTAGGRVLKSDSISLYYGDSADHGALILSADGTSLTRELHSNVQKDLLLIKKLALLKVDSSEDFRGMRL